MVIIYDNNITDINSFVNSFSQNFFGDFRGILLLAVLRPSSVYDILKSGGKEL